MISGKDFWGRLAPLAIVIAGMFWWGECWAVEQGETEMPVFDTLLSRMILYIKTNYTRATWDDLMRWVNFFILVWLVVRYARTPVVHFLKGKKTETAQAIERLEENKRQAEAKIQDGQQQLQNSQERLALIKERVSNEGKRLKAKLIMDAKRESRVMLESAKVRVENQIRDAYEIVRAELIETAADKALAKLPGIITEQDHQNMIGLWMEEARRHA